MKRKVSEETVAFLRPLLVLTNLLPFYWALDFNPVRIGRGKDVNFLSSSASMHKHEGHPDGRGCPLIIAVIMRIL
jgi:hypothetical protein